MTGSGFRLPLLTTLLSTLLPALSLSLSPRSLSTTQSSVTYSLGSNFSFVWNANASQISIASSGTQDIIWATVPGTSFVSASAGNDSVEAANGNFKITQVDEDYCLDQTVTSVAQSSDGGVIVGGELSNCIGVGTLFGGETSAQYTLQFSIPQGFTDRVAFALNVTGSTDDSFPLNKAFLSYQSDASEDFYGFGAQPSFASLKGQSIPIFSREQGAGRGDEPLTTLANLNSFFSGGDKFTTYTAIPQYITTDGHVFYLTEQYTAYTNFDLTQPDVVTVRYDGLSVGGHVSKVSPGKDSVLLDAVELLTEYTGRMPVLPTWVDTGAVLGIQGGQDKVNGIVVEALNSSTPIAAVWLQDWVGTHSQTGPYVNISRLWWNWENDEVLYPNWTSFVQNLRDTYDIRTLSYVNTFLANVSTKSSGFKRNLYDEATSQHYLVQNITVNSTAIISSGPGLDAGIVDLTNDDTTTWFANVLTNQVWNSNISGFMTDFGEYTPVSSDVALASGEDAFTYHSRYPFQWAQLNRQIVEDLDKTSEAVLFHRSASFLTNRYMNLFWAGDQNVNWDRNDGIKSVVPIMVHMGFSGYAQSHSDIGGYTTILSTVGNVTRSQELLGRWGELAAVSSAVFRSHEGNIPSVNAQFYCTGATYAYYAYNARLFAALATYRHHVLDSESTPRGWPLLRSPVIYHTADTAAREISYESFYLGSELYVAPVYDSQTFTVAVYLPGDTADGEGRTYTHVWSNITYGGGQTVDVDAPYGQPAIFVVNNSTAVGIDELWEFVKKESGTVLLVE